MPHSCLGDNMVKEREDDSDREGSPQERLRENATGSLQPVHSMQRLLT